MVNSFSRSIWVWVIPGIIGLMLFFLLRGNFDFMDGAPVSSSKTEAIEKAGVLFSDLGHSPDTTALVPFRSQRVSLYLGIKDSLQSDAPTPGELNREQFFLNGWEVISGFPLPLNESFNLTPASIYNSGGYYRARWDNSGALRLFEINRTRTKSGLLTGENSLNFAEELISTTLSVDLSGYSPETSDTLLTATSGDPLPAGTVSGNNDTAQSVTTYRWIKENGDFPSIIELQLETVETDQLTESGVEISGVRLLRFESYSEMEMIATRTAEQDFLLFFLSMVTLIGVLVFIEGIGQLFKGKADWSRILIVALLISLAIYGWRFIFLLNFSGLFTSQTNIILQFNQIVFAVVLGLFAAIAYIGWEAHARNEKSFQIRLVDALWRGRSWFHETGSAIIKGFSAAGIMLGITALILTITGAYLFQSDSQFGYAEVVNRPFLLSANLSIFSVAALSSIAIVGIISNFLDKKIRNSKVAVTLTVILTGLAFTGLGRTFGTTGTVYEDILLFILFAIPVVAAYRSSGVVTVFAALWLFTAFTTILPYTGAPSFDLAIQFWGQIAIAATILGLGIAAYLNAPSVHSVSSYVPDYEKKLLRSMRFESEMEIARKTQQKLMPLLHPETDQYELYGYFIPSYEVGGDYFDYVTQPGPNGKECLTLAVVDVSGKSMRAAMHAVFTSGLLRSRMYTDKPSRILREISPVLFEKTDNQTFITCMIARFDPGNMQLSIANAGHCLPILKRNGKTEYLHMPDPKYPLGVRELVDYTDRVIDVQPDDVFIFYSDGFPEAVNSKGERIGFDRALEMVRELDTKSMSAREIGDELRKQVESFSTERLADDTTILCLKVKRPESET
ncbi:MAG: SpoIIE family protein phosphatase [Balneolaceae bacterium]|nr:SpoIIE family protein phosphatase [Balneolaceae bacterium]MCH8549646.1 SpoIIE family protein phosphatase [Balneolaceae bacterium]